MVLQMGFNALLSACRDMTIARVPNRRFDLCRLTRTQSRPRYRWSDSKCGAQLSTRLCGTYFKKQNSQCILPKIKVPSDSATEAVEVKMRTFPLFPLFKKI